jgi:glycine betaine/proline transport system ATP-binding protein
VRDFVREVPRAGVLTLRWVVRPLTPDDRLDGPELDARVLVATPLARCCRPTCP